MARRKALTSKPRSPKTSIKGINLEILSLAIFELICFRMDNSAGGNKISANVGLNPV
jgi:hypothetical protein